jgi:ribosomal protein S1
LYCTRTMRSLIILAALLPLALCFTPSPVFLRGSKQSVCQHASVTPSLRSAMRTASFSLLKMSEDAADAGATVKISEDAADAGATVEISEVAADAAPATVEISEVAADAGATETVAGIDEVSDEERRSLDKTRTKRRPRTEAKDKKPLTDFTVGDMVAGKVVSIMPYGAFVDIGTTTDGLVHVSQLADEYVSDINAVVSVGLEVTVRVVSIDQGINKISLSMKSKNAPSGGGGQRGGGGGKGVPEQFKNFDEKTFITGKVASVMDYGCFVSIGEDSTDALVHVSQMSEERVESPEKFVKVGQEVQVRIINYDKSKNRLSLSMKKWTETVPRDDTEDIKSYTDPVPEEQKTSFQIAWEAAQKQKV